MGEATDKEKAMLEEWTRERDDLNNLIAALEKRIAARGGSAGAVVTGGGIGKIDSDEFFRLSTPEAIKKFLKIVGKPARSTQDIIDGLTAGGMDTNYTNVYTALGRLQRRDGVIAKVGENWGLDEWYPRAPREKAPNELTTSETSEQLEEFFAADKKQETITPEVSADHNAKGKGRKQAIAAFLRKHGPSTRTEILAGTDVPEGSFAYCMKDTHMFIKDEDGKYRNVE